MMVTRLVAVMFGVLSVVPMAMGATDDPSRKEFTAGSDVTAGSGLYIGAGLGQSQSSLSTAMSKDSDVAYNLFIGYQINRNLAAELGYANLGKVTTSAGAVSGKSSVGSFTLVGSAPLSDAIAVYGKFGLSKSATKWDAPLSPGMAVDQSKTNLTWGAGLNFDVSPHAGMRLSFDRYSIGATAVTGYANLLSLSVLVKL